MERRARHSVLSAVGAIALLALPALGWCQDTSGGQDNGASQGQAPATQPQPSNPAQTTPAQPQADQNPAQATPAQPPADQNQGQNNNPPAATNQGQTNNNNNRNGKSANPPQTPGAPVVDTSQIDWSVPGAGDVVALDTMQRLHIDAADIEAILPLMQDLAQDRQDVRAAMTSVTDDYLGMNANETPGTSADQRIASVVQGYRDKEQKIWNTVSDRIGATKANGLRDLVQGTPNVDTYASNFDEEMGRIDALITRWDQIRTANGTTTTTTQTQVTTTPAPSSVARTGFAHVSTGPDMTFFEPGAVTPSELVDLMEQRLVALKVPDDTVFMLTTHGRRLTEPDMVWAWERRMQIWK